MLEIVSVLTVASLDIEYFKPFSCSPEIENSMACPDVCMKKAKHTLTFLSVYQSFSQNQRILGMAAGVHKSIFGLDN